MTGPHHQKTEADRIAREAEQPKRREWRLYKGDGFSEDLYAYSFNRGVCAAPADHHVGVHVREVLPGDPTPEAIAGLIKKATAVVNGWEDVTEPPVLITELSAALKAVQDAK